MYVIYISYFALEVPQIKLYKYLKHFVFLLARYIATKQWMDDIYIGCPNNLIRPSIIGLTWLFIRSTLIIFLRHECGSFSGNQYIFYPEIKNR